MLTACHLRKASLDLKVCCWLLGFLAQAQFSHRLFQISCTSVFPCQFKGWQERLAAYWSWTFCIWTSWRFFKVPPGSAHLCQPLTFYILHLCCWFKTWIALGPLSLCLVVDVQSLSYFSASQQS